MKEKQLMAMTVSVQCRTVTKIIAVIKDYIPVLFVSANNCNFPLSVCTSIHPDYPDHLYHDGLPCQHGCPVYPYHPQSSLRDLGTKGSLKTFFMGANKRVKVCIYKPDGPSGWSLAW